MFAFLRRSGVRRPSPAIQRALEARGLPSGMDPAALGMVASRGKYAGRGVTYFRIFDPLRAAERGVEVHTSRDLDAHPELVLAAGHVERDGSVALTAEVGSVAAPASARERADRAAHGDDERFVFPDTGR